jgi:sugar transferase (PEP-CTERM system associated)
MSTIATTTYRAPSPSPSGWRSTTRGAIAAWHCSIAYTTAWLVHAELGQGLLAGAGLFAAVKVGALSPSAAAGAAVLVLLCRLAAYAAGRRAFVTAEGAAFVKGLVRSTVLAALSAAALFTAWPVLAPPLPLTASIVLGSAAVCVLLRWTTRGLIRRGRLVEDCLILGTTEKAARFFDDLRAAQPGAVSPVANGSPDGSCIVEFEHLLRLAQNGSDSRLVVVETPDDSPDLHEVLLDCRLRGMAIEQAMDAYERLAGRVWVEGLQPDWIIYGRGFRRPAPYRAAKRVLDLAAAVALLALTLPVLLLVALLIKIESPGPILFAQERVGHHGRTFTLYKFRSMRRDAESQSGPVWAGENDARITPLGRILRKCRLDELPQIWNVLRGEMSFVGPRPERPYFVDLLRQQIPFYDLRHYVPPGITGWAQVSYPYGASVEDAYQKLQYDLYYGKHMSLRFDIEVLVKTVSVVLMGRGAR